MLCPKCKDSHLLPEREKHYIIECTLMYCFLCGYRDYSKSRMVPLKTDNIFGWKNLKNLRLAEGVVRRRKLHSHTYKKSERILVKEGL
jgi:hypothetical protein